MISVIGSESVPALPRSFAVRRLDALLRARVAELADEEARMGALRRGDAVEDGVDLVDRLVLVAADLELDERRVPVLRDRRLAADVLDGRDLRDARDDVRDRGREGGIARPQRAALDQDALGGGLLEAGVEDPVHAAGLARPGACSGRCSSCRPCRRARRRRRRRRASRRWRSSSARRSSGPCGPRGCATSADMTVLLVARHDVPPQAA